MKKIFIILFFTATIFACKKNEDSVYPGSDGMHRSIEMIDYKRGDTVFCEIIYNSSGLAQKLKVSKTWETGIIPDMVTVDYERGKLKTVSVEYLATIRTGNSVPAVYTSNFFYGDNQHLDSVKSFTSSGGFQGQSFNGLFIYYNQNKISSVVTTYNFDTYQKEEEVTDTFEYVVTTSGNVKLISGDDEECPDLVHEFDQRSSFEYNYYENCNRINFARGAYSKVENNLQKPIWDVLVKMVPGLEPINGYLYGIVQGVYYLPDMVPDYFVQSVSDQNGGASYEYTTDEEGNILSIKEIQNSETTKLVRFIY